MAILSKSGGEDEEDRVDAAAGTPDPFSIDFDPNDPDQTKVHYNLTGWSFDQRAELSETLAERGVPHVWEEEELVVPEEIEAAVDALFDELEAEIGPFPVPLLEGDASTEFGLDEWPARDIETLRDSIIEAEIPHLWQGRTLLVAQDAEDVVDDLLDAIEAGRLARDATHSAGRSTILELVPQLSPTVPPFGMAAGAWGVIVGHAQALNERFEEGADTELVQAQADELRSVCRPYV